MAVSSENQGQPAEITVGSAWITQDGGRWQVVAERYDGPGTYRVVKIDAEGKHTKTFDTVWGAELHGEARRVR